MGSPAQARQHEWRNPQAKIVAVIVWSVLTSRDATDTRSELGTRFDHAWAVSPDAVLVFRGRVAWAHDWVSDPSLTPLFLSLPTASFTVTGAISPHDSALTSVGAELRFANHISLLAKFDGQFGSNSQTYAGTGKIRFSNGP